MYISETASVLLGLPQIDLTGSSIFDYVHPADHNDLLDMLSLDAADRCDIQAQLAANRFQSDTSLQVEHLELGRSFSMRMKCILPKRNAGLIQNGYKSIHCTGYLKVKRAQQQKQQSQKLLQLQKLTGAPCGQPDADAKSNMMPRFPDKNYSSNTATTTTSEPEWESYALVAVGHSLLPTASTEIKLNRNSFMFRANLDMKIYYMEAS
jgi:single-minded-like protein